MNRQLMIGLAGHKLSERERHWLREAPPLGVILFGRNVADPEQVRALIEESRQVAGKPLWAAIDEEGGRVNRMAWPPFSGRRHAADWGDLYRTDAQAALAGVRDDAHVVGVELARLGFTHDCAPVLDLLLPGGHAVIGRRSYGDSVATVTALGAAAVQGLQAAGVAAIGKHFPGHGRANLDSHLAVPVVDAPLEQLLAEAEPFRQLIGGELRHLMSAHVIYDRCDSAVATCSPFWLKEILRGRFGFAGTLWSDDLCMKGVGDSPRIAAERAQAAGCDVLLVCEPQGVAEVYG